ncbi:MAG TPA: helix-turn-helix domain-containing protein [Candidatus Manganitrophaceae bacterium]|nr:helix-turn-helix domain-containing protein [Candidatus Manganitrophaceae bacterium]
MKRFSDQNYYEILEVAYHATWGEIQKAYELAKKTYGPESMASYSLFESEDRDVLFKKIEEAYRVLIDPENRRKYDKSISSSVKEIALRPAEPAADRVSSAVSEGGERPPGEMNGKALREMRERQGVSLQQIADLTRINVTYLQFIEESQFKSLPAEVYLRNYLLQYAKTLHLDPKSVVEGYMEGYERWRGGKEKTSPA